MEIVPVILAGGRGSRLWPYSRSLMPKQFLPLMNGKSLLQHTIERVESLHCRRSVIVCNREQLHLVAAHIESSSVEFETLVEPFGKNTAPAITIASLIQKPNDLILVLTSDHLIEPIDEFATSIDVAAKVAEDGRIVTFGIKPTEPNTGYGYIAQGEPLSEGGASLIKRFVEKPTLETAQEYCRDGSYLWNSGMFMFLSKVFLSQVELYRRDILTACEETLSVSKEVEGIRYLDEECFDKCPEDSVDYAVMEKTSIGAVVSMPVRWNDLGSWSALWQEKKTGKLNNAIEGDVVTANVANSLIQSESRLVVANDVQDLVIVETADAILVSSLKQASELKPVLEELKNADRDELETPPEVIRPWGSYSSLIQRDGYQVKKIEVNPGHQISVQYHNHRSEVWTVVEGKAEVTNGDKRFSMVVGQTTSIPQGQIHCLANNSDSALVIIEVQLGAYLGEDDIVRLEDKYGRI